MSCLHSVPVGSYPAIVNLVKFFHMLLTGFCHIERPIAQENHHKFRWIEIISLFWSIEPKNMKQKTPGTIYFGTPHRKKSVKKWFEDTIDIPCKMLWILQYREDYVMNKFKLHWQYFTGYSTIQTKYEEYYVE